MKDLILKVKKNNKWETVIYKEFKIFTGYTDKNNKKIYTGDEFIYTEKDSTQHPGEVCFSIENGIYIKWNTWHPFRKDFWYWFQNYKKDIEVINDER